MSQILENLFSSELKIKILRLLYKEKKLRFIDIKEKLSSGAGSTKNVLENFVENEILKVSKISERKKIYYINEEYIELIRNIFSIEEEYEFKNKKKKMYKTFFEL